MSPINRQITQENSTFKRHHMQSEIMRYNKVLFFTVRTSSEHVFYALMYSAFLVLCHLRWILLIYIIYKLFADKDGSKVTTVVATPGQGSDRPQEVSYTDTKVIGNGSFGVVYQAKLVDTSELVAIKKVLQDKRFKVGAK